MLRELHVRDFALLEAVRVEFGPGLNVLTGETGAGKSILVDALGVAVGQRASSDLVRAGAEEARVTAVFDLSRVPELAARVDALGVGVEEGLLVLAREVGGRGRAYANGAPVSVSTLRRIGEIVLEIHGQHEGQRLLELSSHLDLLDAFGGEGVLAQRRRVAELVRRWSERRAALRAVETNERERAQRLDLLRFQVAEIDAARLRPGELDALQEARTRLANAERLREALGRAYDALYGADGSTSDALGRAAASLAQAATWAAELGELAATVQALREGAVEAAREARRALDRVEADPAQLERVEARLASLQALMRKYGDSLEGVMAYREQAATEIETLSAADARREEIASELTALQSELAEEASRLSRLRREAAGRMEKAVLVHLRELAMPAARFEVAFGRREDAQGVPVGGEIVAVGERGADRVEFLFSANPGEPPRPLHRVASGGELSRVLLALRSALIGGDPPPIMVFDEIDAGVGGRTGHVIGQKLAALATRSQVLCVTHLAQIAVFADHHYAVGKVTERGRTRAVVERLEREARVEEVARMLAGPQPTEMARRHAREMLRRPAPSAPR
ncbi:MAG: DNA repair protein RecN [Armatimonadota bacterium]|nr:DNA repair protein RecN [Armatimonadota bacterium]